MRPTHQILGFDTEMGHW